MSILKTCRIEKLGITQLQMADRLGVSLYTVKAWEQGKRFIKVNDLSEVSRAYSFSMLDLIEYLKECSI